MASCKFCGEKEPVLYCVCAGCMDKLQFYPIFQAIAEMEQGKGEYQNGKL